jgi:hypothetical protein
MYNSPRSAKFGRVVLYRDIDASTPKSPELGPEFNERIQRY